MTTAPESPADTFASRLKQLMDAKGFNQSTLSKKSGIDRSVINRMLRGTRHPRPFEIGVLAQCFEVAPETLMSGVRLPPQVQRAVDLEAVRTEQLLAANSARDEAEARAKQSASEVERLQAQLEREREDARRQRDAADVAWKKQLRDTEAAHASELKRVNAALTAKDSELERLGTKFGAAIANQLVLRRQIAELQHQVAQERSSKAGAGVIGGLVGIALGRAMD